MLSLGANFGGFSPHSFQSKTFLVQRTSRQNNQTHFSLLKIGFSQSQTTAALSPWLLPSGSMLRGPWRLRDGDVGGRLGMRRAPASRYPLPTCPLQPEPPGLPAPRPVSVLTVHRFLKGKIRRLVAVSFNFQNLPGTDLAVSDEGRVERGVPRTDPAAGAFPGLPPLPPARLTSAGLAVPAAVRTV